MAHHAPTESDKAAVAELAQRVVAAWSGQDADAFADLFVDDGTMILPGGLHSGRAEIRRFMAHAFDTEYKASHVTGQALGLRFLCSDVALLLTEGGMLAPGATEVPGDQEIRASWLAVKRDGQWLLANYQNSPRNQHGSKQH
jgi:uncharacterized protein (TIGR02246 family)